jgi:hypothetical protein
MKMEPKRYRVLKATPNGKFVEMTVDPNGSMVMYTAYATLAERNRVLVETLIKVKKLAAAGLNGYGEVVYNSNNELKILELIRAALANEPTPGQEDTEAAHDRS